MIKIISAVHGFLWGVPSLVLILGVGLYLSIRTGFAQIRLFPWAMLDLLRKLWGREVRTEGVSSFQALCTALAATVGTGNLVGVAGAICLGGPGAVFWMWICGILGMVTKYAEVVLAVHYRVRQSGENFGGPMYIICRGMGQKWKWLASLYSIFGVVAAFGVGNATQINAVLSGINDVLGRFGLGESDFRNFLIGLVLAILIGAMLLGGAKRIGLTAEKLVPFVSAVYILLCLGVLTARWHRIGQAFDAIFRGAFSPRAVTGGILGSAFQALKVGCARGVFTNEAGMGTASIAHASAETDHPAHQGLMGIVEVFLDTILICTLTALVILVSGVPVTYGVDSGGILTTNAFASVYGGWISGFLAVALCCFAFATVLGWGFYGARCAQFLFGKAAWKPFALLQTVTVVFGAVMKTDTVWLLAEIVNGLMAIPNLIALAALSTEVVRLTKEYTQNPANRAPVEVPYANFYQRKPLRAFSYAEIPSSGSGCQEGRQEDLSSEHRSA